MKIGIRLGAGFALILGLVVTMTLVGLWRLEAVADGTDKIAAGTRNERLSNEWLQGIAVNATRTLAVAKSDDAETRKFFQDEMAAQSGKITAIQQELEKLIIDDAGKHTLAEVAKARTTYVAVRNDIFKKQKEGAAQDALKSDIDGKLLPALKAYVQSVQAVVDHQRQQQEQANKTVQAIEESGSTLLLALGAAALILGTALAWFLSRSITHPLSDAVRIARTVASGDLTSKIDIRSRDETGQLLEALKHMNDSLLDIVKQVRNGTDSIATASVQIAAGNVDLSSRTEEQASALEETASSMEQLTSAVRHNADNARHANQLADDASRIAVQGSEVVSQVVSTMDAINNASRKIVDIISVIDGIAFQTNILALNAAVEAARAGEQGRGFAVVASEVRSLAQRSSAAAKEIKALIDDSVSCVDNGTALVGQAGATMDKVVASIHQVSEIVVEITAAGQEQSTGIEHINLAIAQMEQVTQQNAALVEEAAAATEAMQQQASHLAGMVSKFTLDSGPAPAKTDLAAV